MEGHLTAIERMRWAARTTPASAAIDGKRFALVSAAFVAPFAALWALLTVLG